jgi:hypothetical protein
MPMIIKWKIKRKSIQLLNKYLMIKNKLKANYKYIKFLLFQNLLLIKGGLNYMIARINKKKKKLF